MIHAPGVLLLSTQGDETNAAYYHSCNRGKQSVSLDFKDKNDLLKLKNLIASADILIENFKVGGLDKYGLDYKTLHNNYPSLIYCSITGFGQTGPYAKRAGYDFLMQGMSGLMSITGEPDRPTSKSWCCCNRHLYRIICRYCSSGSSSISRYHRPWSTHRFIPP
jgi:crotonobetainyl-CoA:carnitine CoA-transferase CaiB-like acyl-CoA transferase